MRAERTFHNRYEFDLEMIEIHEWPARGGVRLRQPSRASVGREGYLEQAFGRCRSADGAEHVNQGA
jgi:hypothetical protein